MRIKLATIDILDTQQQQRELNAFLASHSILAVTKELVRVGECAYWAFCIEYGEPAIGAPTDASDRKPKIDYRGACLFGPQPERRPRSGKTSAGPLVFLSAVQAAANSSVGATAGSPPEGEVERSETEKGRCGSTARYVIFTRATVTNVSFRYGRIDNPPYE